MAILTTSLEESDRIDAFLNHPSFDETYNHAIYRGLLFTMLSLRWEGTPSTLSDAFVFSQNDLTTYRNCLRSLGYEADTVAYKVNESSKLNWEGPGLIQTEAISFVVLNIKSGVAEGYDYLNDTEIEIDLSKRDFTLCYPTAFSQMFRESSEQGVGARGWVRTLAAPYIGKVKEILLNSFMINLLGALNPFFIMSIYQFALPAASKENLLWIVIGAVLIAFGEFFFRKKRSAIFEMYGSEIATKISHEVLKKLIWLPYSRTSTASESAQLARIRDIDNIRKVLVSESTQSWFDLPFVFIFLIAILVLAGSTALIVVVGVIAMIVFATVARTVTSLAATQSSQAAARLQSQWHELLSTLESIQGLPLENVVRLRFQTALEKSEAEALSSRYLNQKITSLGTLLTQVIGASCIIYASYLVMNGDLDFGSMLAIVLLVWKCLSPFVGVYHSVNRLKQLDNSVQQVDALMQLPDERLDLNKSTPVYEISASAQLIDLSLRIPNSEFTLSQISLKLNARGWLAVSGPSGSGKSTLMSVFLRLIDNYQGKVLIDNMSIRQFNAYNYRKLVRSKPQTLEFFELSLRENFAMFSGYSDDLHVERFLKHMHIEKYFEQGVQSQLSPSLIDSLPNDVQQSLALVVSIGSHDGGLIILDEPLVGADTIYHKRLVRWLKDTYPNASFIMISNDRELIANCDSVLLLSADGQQKYFGSADKVLENYDSLLNTNL